MTFLVVLAQLASAPPPAPPAAFHDWAALLPVEKSDRVSVLCRADGRITAEFIQARGVVSVVDIEGISHRLAPAERTTINAAVRDLGILDRVQVGCNDRSAVITVIGAFSEVDGRMLRRSVSIVWHARGIEGMGGRTRPAMELRDERR